MSDEGIVQLGGVFVELKERRGKKKQKRIRKKKTLHMKNLLNQIPSCKKLYLIKSNYLNTNERKGKNNKIKQQKHMINICNC